MKEFTQVAAAKYIKTTPQQLNRHVKSGRLRLNNSKKIDQDELERFKVELADKKNGRLSLFDEQARFTKIKADLAALELGQKEGELVEVADVVDELGRLFFIMRSRILAQATKIAPRGANKSTGALFKIISDENRQLLIELSEYTRYTDEFRPVEPSRKNRKRSAKVQQASTKKTKKNKKGTN